MPVIQITSLDQYVQVTEQHNVSVVQFGTSLPCSAKMNKLFAHYSAKYPSIDFYQVEIDAEHSREIVRNAGVLAYPTYLIFEGGVEGGVDAVVGPRPKDLERTLQIFSPSPPSSPGFP